MLMALVASTGYVGSGPIVLLLELVLQVGPRPSVGQIVILFELVAAFTIAGMSPQVQGNMFRPDRPSLVYHGLSLTLSY